ncbi:MAG: preprotein translocase subunit SecG [Anaerolineae bacterium]|nr:preprotein translocase subunit SecG [Anaerolineae bacterium]MDW8102643.1 preprotein translocase subunit SecG [Anaerolineae bacterium]
MRTYFYLIQIIISLALIVVILLGSKGGGLSSIFGGEGGIYRTRRGVEKVLFQAAIVLSALFLLVSLLSVILFQ